MDSEMMQVSGELVGLMPTPTGDWNVTVLTGDQEELLVLMSDEQLVETLAENDLHSREFWLSWLARLRADLGYLRTQKPLC